MVALLVDFVELGHGFETGSVANLDKGSQVDEVEVVSVRYTEYSPSFSRPFQAIEQYCYSDGFESKIFHGWMTVSVQNSFISSRSHPIWIEINV